MSNMMTTIGNTGLYNWNLLRQNLNICIKIIIGENMWGDGFVNSIGRNPITMHICTSNHQVVHFTYNFFQSYRRDARKTNKSWKNGQYKKFYF